MGSYMDPFKGSFQGSKGALLGGSWVAISFFGCNKETL